MCMNVRACMQVVYSGGRGWGDERGKALPGPGCPLSPCVKPVFLFVRVADTHAGTHQPKLLQLTAVPLRCPTCGVLARVTRYGLGTVSPVT